VLIISQQGMAIISLKGGADDMADNYVELAKSNGTFSSLLRIGYSKTEKITQILYTDNIFQGEIKSMHFNDNSTSYRNLSGTNARFYLTVRAIVIADPRIIKIYSSPTDDSISGATLLQTLDDSTGYDFNAINDTVSSDELIVQNNHYIVLENDTTVTNSHVTVLAGNSVVIESI
jgi:hypothetical protein